MKNLRIFVGSRLLLLAGLLYSGSVLAIDGDMDYTAPYIMVDPATGKVVTVNPGPRPKAHPDMGENGQQSGAEVLVATPANAGGVMETTSAATASTTPAMIALWGALFYVIAGYLLARRSKIHNIYTTSRHGNH